MPRAPIPNDEQARLSALREYRILDTPAEDSFDDIAELARRYCDTPTALVSLIDEGRQWFKSRLSFEYAESDRDIAFCAHTILAEEPMVVEDAQRDERFAANPLVTDDPRIRFYAGAPIVNGQGHALGTVAVIDYRPRALEDDQLDALRRLARQALAQLELRRLVLQREDTAQDLAEQHARLAADYRALFERNPLPGWIYDTESLRILSANSAAVRHYGWSAEEFTGLTLWDLRPQEEHARLREFLLAGRTGSTGVWTHRRRDGSLIEVEVHSGAMRYGDSSARFVIAQDVTERRRAEARIRRQNRMLAVLSSINGLIVRVRDRTSLFDGACRIAVGEGGIAAAWIGWVDKAGRALEPVACADDAGTFCGRLGRVVLPDDGTRTLIGEAMQSREPVVVADFDDEDDTAEHATAQAAGFRSMAVLPLLRGNEARGALVLFSRRAGSFDSEQVGLLTELTDDVAFALTHLETEERMRFLAHYDPLTGLANRALLLEVLQPLLEHAASEGEGGGIAVMDIDRFRQVNESLGRSAADAVLREIGERLRASTHGRCIVARLGADRFAVAGRGIATPEAARAVLASGLEAVFEQPLHAAGRELHLAAKAGVALFPRDADGADALLAKAEAALRDAKRSGESWVFHAPDISTRLARSLDLESRLRAGIGRDELTLHYQPIVEAGDGRLRGVEGLMRWNAPGEGLVGPDRFIAVMEETGLILEAGRWALRHVLEDCRQWQSRAGVPPRVALNISARQLRAAGFVDEVAEAAAALQRIGSVLELELTESILMENVGDSVRKLGAVREAGARIAIDDFGTGYSSLSYLARLPVDVLKVDREFVLHALDQDYCRTIVTTVITLAHSLGLRVVAEGVENARLAQFLRELRCDELQGYLLARPQPPEQIDPMLAPGWRGLPGEAAPEVP